MNLVRYAFLTTNVLMQVSPARAFAAVFAKHAE
jgi:hypothetical protein